MRLTSVAHPLSIADQAASNADVLAVEHPAKRRIRQANELADAMRQTGGKHRSDLHQANGYGTDWTIQVNIVPVAGNARRAS